jgi:hypothetical protein
MDGSITSGLHRLRIATTRRKARRSREYGYSQGVRGRFVPLPRIRLHWEMYSVVLYVRLQPLYPTYLLHLRTVRIGMAQGI